MGWGISVDLYSIGFGSTGTLEVEPHFHTLRVDSFDIHSSLSENPLLGFRVRVRV